MPPTKKVEYQTDLPVIVGVGIAFLIFAIMSIVPPMSTWIHEIGTWLSVLASLCFFPGLIMIAVAIGLTYQKRGLKQTVKKAILAGDYGSRVNLELIAGDFNLSHGDMRRLLTDLRMAGELRVSFDSKTGEVIFPDLSGSSVIGGSEVVNGNVYCSYCGLQLAKDSSYCPGCGANLH